MFATPSELRLLRQLDLKHRRAIGKYPALAFDLAANLLRQSLQTIAQYLVIVAPQGIARHESTATVLQHLPRVFRVRRVIVHAHGDDAQSAGHQLRRTGAFHAMFCHIIHRAVMSVRKPLHQVCLGQSQVGIADAHRLKSKRLPPRFNFRGEFFHISLRCCVLHEPNHSRSDVSKHSARALAIHLPDEAATIDFASQFAHSLHPGLVIYLRGHLGAGKTTFVRALLQTLGYTGRVKSPTYTLLEQYSIAGWSLRHFDLYRFRDAEEWESAGFRDEFDGKNICLVEWPEQASGLLPPADISLTFEILQDERELWLHAYTLAGQTCLNALSA